MCSGFVDIFGTEEESRMFINVVLIKRNTQIRNGINVVALKVVNFTAAGIGLSKVVGPGLKTFLMASPINPLSITKFSDVIVLYSVPVYAKTVDMIHVAFGQCNLDTAASEFYFCIKPCCDDVIPTEVFKVNIVIFVII